MDYFWPSSLEIGAPLAVVLVGGQTFKGRLMNLEGPWATIEGPGGAMALRNDMVLALGLDGHIPPLKGKSGGGTSASSRASAGTKVEVVDDNLKKITEAFLDGEVDKDIASRFDVPSRQVKTLRQAFECARGNLVEDQISAAAREMIPRLQEALCG